jgi:hypothetical protein
VKTLAIIAAVFLALAMTANGQIFEGKVGYQNTYKSKLPGVTDEQLAASMGSRQDYLIKGGNYKSISNGAAWTWQIYSDRDNKLYNKMSDSDVILWIDGAGRSDQILETKLNKAVTEVLGYACDEIVLTLKNGVEKYYFNSKLGIDPSVYSKHLYGNWYDYLKLAKAVPLKMIIETPQFVMTSTAIEVKAMKLSATDFQLPEGAKTAKMPA